jgi:hypothetical protein
MGQLRSLYISKTKFLENAMLLVIFKAKIDMRSGTPAYKRVPVFVFG